MKGKYVFDVRGLPDFQALIMGKAVELGCEMADAGDRPEGLEDQIVFVNLGEKKYTVYGNVSFEDYERRYGFAEYEQISVQEFLRLEKPPVKVALSLFVTEAPDWEEALKQFGGTTEARVAGINDIHQYAGQITRDDVMKAAEQACRALGV